MENSKKGNAMKWVHYIVTAALVGLVIWLVIAEVKRMKMAKELANSGTGTGTGTETA